MSGDAFSAAMDALFSNADMAADATWVPQGANPAKDVRVIRRKPDQVNDWAGAQVVQDSEVLEIRVSDAPTLAEGDRLLIGDETLVIRGEPVRDSLGLVWTAEAGAA